MILVEEKYGRKSLDGALGSASAATAATADNDDEDSDSTSESDEDEGVLATQQVDDEISATLQAIRTKDPRLYDKAHNFYSEQQQSFLQGRIINQDKPVTLQDYHRKNLLEGGPDIENNNATLRSHEQEQDAWKRNLVNQIHGATTKRGNSVGDSEDEEFLQAKPPAEPIESEPGPPSIAEADKDPDAFLKSLMASRAWVPTDKMELHPFESDDEEEENRADEFEEAYNLRFEDPQHANEKLLSHSRSTAAEYSVRREKVKGRKKVRQIEKSHRQAEKEEREREKTRLRNLRIEQAHGKLEQFKDAAGLRDQDLPVEEWSHFLNAAFDSDKWDDEMQKRFGDFYYSTKDDVVSNDYNGKNKFRKPKWNEEINIDDIVPGFEDENDNNFSLSDEASTQVPKTIGNGDERHDTSDGQGKVPDELEKMEEEADLRAERKRRARQEHRKIEELVDSGLTTEILPDSTSKTKAMKGFRYRETSPTSFGLSSRDILLADDRLLNQHHGLKKLAAFRDSSRKDKDKRKLDKKRLRKWRKEAFGNTQGPQTTFQDYVQSKLAGRYAPEVLDKVPDMKQESAAASKTKKKRRRPKKDAAQEELH